MADELERYWFVAAVFREPQDLLATIAELGNSELAGDRLLVVSRWGTGDALKALDGPGQDPVRIVTMQPDGAWLDGDGHMRLELRSILEAMEGSEQAQAANLPLPAVRNGQAKIYAQLRQDVVDGAFVLIASVASAQEQLQWARIMLRGNCECVLTDELAVQHR